MPAFKLPNGETIDVPENITPEMGRRLRAYHDSLLPKQDDSQLEGLAQPSEESAPINLESMLSKTKALGKELKGTILPEIARVADTAIRGGVLGIPNLALKAGKALDESDFGKYIKENVPIVGTPIPGLREATDAAIEFSTPMEPQTAIGKQAGNIGASIVGAVTGTTPRKIMEELGKNYLLGGGAGIGAEAAASAFGDNPVSRIAGALLGGGAAGILTSAKGNQAELAQQALKGLDQNDLSRATKVMKEAQVEGVPLNLSQALGKESNVDAFIDVLAKDPSGVQTAKVLREQPMRIVEGANRRITNLPGNIKDVHTVANELQSGATKVIKKEVEIAGDIWQNTRDKFAFTAPKSIPVSNLNAVINDLNDLAAKHVKGTADYNVIDDLRRLIHNEGKGITDPMAMYKALQNYKDGLKGKQNLSNKNLTTDAGKYGQLLAKQAMDKLGDAMKPYREADEAYAKHFQVVIKPLKKSVVGRIAGAKGELADKEAAVTPVESLFKSGTLPGADSQILKLQEELSRAGRGDSFVDSVKTFLAKQADLAFKTDSARVNSNVASSLTNKLGTEINPDSAFRGTKDMLIGVARAKGIKDENALADGFSRFMKIVSHASFRPAPVSGGTQMGIIKTAEKHLGSRIGGFTIISPLRQPMLMMSDKLRRDSFTTMDQLLNSPEGISMLVQLGKSPTMGHKTQTALATSLATLNNLSTSSNQTQVQE